MSLIEIVIILATASLILCGLFLVFRGFGIVIAKRVASLRKQYEQFPTPTLRNLKDALLIHNQHSLDWPMREQIKAIDLVLADRQSPPQDEMTDYMAATRQRFAEIDA